MSTIKATILVSLWLSCCSSVSANLPNGVNVTATVLSATEVLVTWDVVFPMNITIYRVLYQPLETFSGPLGALTVNVSELDNMSVVLTMLEEYVNYTIFVQAFSSVGEGHYSDGVTIQTMQDIPASFPDNISAIASSSTSIVVTWDIVPPIDQNGVITMYQVFYQPMETFGGVIGSLAVNMSGTVTSVVLEDIQEYVNYTISVRAYTSVGEGPYSDGVVERTNEDAPATPPSNVTAIVTSPRNITVMWEELAPIDQNGVITMYQVLYQPLETFGGAIGPLTTNVTELTADLIDLEEFVNYTISVRAYTSVGGGPFSEGITVLTNENVPTSPPSNVMGRVVSSTAIMVTWDIVPPIDQNGVIISYEVLYQPLETFNGTIRPSVAITQTPYLAVNLTRLEEYVLYNISVRAVTSGGSGIYSEEIQERTLEDAPSQAPLIAEAMVISPTVVEVSWFEVDPIHQNGIITVYEVDYQPFGTFNNSEEVSRVNMSSTTIELTDLHESVQYNITVRAFTSAGAGPFSSAVLSVTHEAAPASSPNNVRGRSISSSEIMVTWDVVPPIDQNGIIINYEVLYQPLETFDGTIEPLTVNVSMRDLSVVLRNLQEYINYNVSIRAFTVVGEGPFSDWTTVMTNEDAPSGPPTNITATVLSSTSIMVVWDMVPLIDQNGGITMYQVLYQPMETFGGAIGPQAVNVSDINTEVPVFLMDLEEFVNYTISVRAYTSVGGGPYSQGIVLSTLEDVPSGAPTNVVLVPVSFTEMMVTWDVVPPIDQNGIITMYQVLYWPLHAQNGTRAMNVSILTTNLTLAALGSYRISVRAYNTIGVGPCSENVTASIPPQDLLPQVGLVPDPDPQKMLPVDPGTRHTLTCNVTHNPAFPNTTQLQVTWLDPHNRTIERSDYNYSMTEHMVVGSDMLFSMLEFNYMLTSQAGPYTCVVNMTVPQLATHYSISRTLVVTVELKVASISFVSSRSGTLYVGTSYEVVCFVTLGNASAVGTNVQARIQIAPQDRISIGDISRVNDTTFSSNVIFSVLKRSDRALPIILASVSPIPRSPFIHRSPLLHKVSNIRLGVQPLPLPVVTLPSAPGLHTDIGEPLSLNCVASIVNHLVVHPIMEWLLPNGTRISRNLTVLGTSNVSETVYTSMLSFDSIQASDRGLYRCNVSISIPEVPVAVFSMNVTTLSIRLTEPVVTVSTPTTPLWINTTESTEVTCSVAPSNDTATGTTSYTITWRQLNGSILHNDSRIRIVFPSISSSVLSLLPLSVVDYSLVCDVVADTLLTDDYILASVPVTANGFLRIKIPPPTVNITSDAHFYAGLPLNLTCYIHLTSTLDQQDIVSLSSNWAKGATALTTDEQLSIEQEPVFLGNHLYKTSLVIPALDASGSDNGEYTCSVNILSNSNFVMGASVISLKNVFVEALLFQFEIVDTLYQLNCEDWIRTEYSLKVDDIKDEIIRNLNFRCGCGVSTDLITNARFLCMENDQAAVSFRAKLHGSPSLSVLYLRDSLKEWLNETTSVVLVGAIRYDIGAFCILILDSDSGQVCLYPSTRLPSTQDTATTTVESTMGEGPPYVVIIVGGAASVLTILILAVACGVVICVIVYAKTKHPSESLREADLQMSTLSCNNSNDYEEHSKYCGDILYAEVGDKEYEAMFSAKIASMEDYSQYVPMASISGSLANLHRAVYPAPTVAPPTYSARGIAPPVYSTLVPAASNAPPIYNTLVRCASDDSSIYATVVPTNGSQGANTVIPTYSNIVPETGTAPQDADTPIYRNVVPATDTVAGDADAINSTYSVVVPVTDNVAQDADAITSTYSVVVPITNTVAGDADAITSTYSLVVPVTDTVAEDATSTHSMAVPATDSDVTESAIRNPIYTTVICESDADTVFPGATTSNTPATTGPGVITTDTAIVASPDATTTNTPTVVVASRGAITPNIVTLH